MIEVIYYLLQKEKIISDFTFCKCSSLKRIAIPLSITTIGKRAFRECTSLKEIIIPPSVTSIGDCAFYGCTSLVQVSIPSSVKSIGYFFFVSVKNAKDLFDLIISGDFVYQLMKYFNILYISKSGIYISGLSNSDTNVYF